MSEEWVYHVDENDNLIGKVTRNEMLEKNLLHRVASIFVLNSSGLLLVHHRTATKDTNPNYVALCFGGVVSYGESYEDCAQRELFEETGIQEAPLVFLGHWRYDAIDTRFFVNVYKTISDGPFSFQRDEVGSTNFLPLDAVQQLVKRDNVCLDTVISFEKYVLYEETIKK